MEKFHAQELTGLTCQGHASKVLAALSRPPKGKRSDGEWETQTGQAYQKAGLLDLLAAAGYCSPPPRGGGGGQQGQRRSSVSPAAQVHSEAALGFLTLYPRRHCCCCQSQSCC